jgi:hypothetical protein
MCRTLDKLTMSQGAQGSDRTERSCSTKKGLERSGGWDEVRQEATNSMGLRANIYTQYCTEPLDSFPLRLPWSYIPRPSPTCSVSLYPNAGDDSRTLPIAGHHGTKGA